MSDVLAPRPGVYRHYKGGLYRVLLNGVVNEGTGERGVVYVSLTTHRLPDGAEPYRLTWRPYHGENGWLELVNGAPRFWCVDVIEDAALRKAARPADGTEAR